MPDELCTDHGQHMGPRGVFKIGNFFGYLCGAHARIRLARLSR